MQLEQGATWTLSAAQQNQFSPFVGGLLNISGGTVSVLSGARLYAVALNESTGSTLVIGLDGPSAASNGEIIVDSTAMFAGTLNVTLEYGFVPAIGEQFQLFSFGGESGQFSNIILPAANHWDTSQLYTLGIITAVPEPTLMAIVLMPAVLLRRRRAASTLAISPHTSAMSASPHRMKGIAASSAVIRVSLTVTTL